jgi:hypothetical protein
VEWDQFATGTGLDPSASTTFAVIVRSAVPSSLQLSPTNAGSPRGVPVNIAATAVDTSGRPYAGKTLRYEITGVNPGTGSVTLGPDGRAVITDPGAVAGDDTIVAFVDFNNDGLRGLAEPQASALATVVDNVSPRCTVRVTGDRPGGGGAGKQLVITVNCNETSTVTVGTKLTPPPTPAGSARAQEAAADQVEEGDPRAGARQALRVQAEAAPEGRAEVRGSEAEGGDDRHREGSVRQRQASQEAAHHPGTAAPPPLRRAPAS